MPEPQSSAAYAPPEPDNEQPITVGQLRAALAECGDDDMVCVMLPTDVRPGSDVPVTWAFGGYLIPWDHNCNGIRDHPGERCPTVPAFEIHVSNLADADA